MHGHGRPERHRALGLQVLGQRGGIDNLVAVGTFVFGPRTRRFAARLRLIFGTHETDMEADRSVGPRRVHAGTREILGSVSLLLAMAS